MNDHKLPYDIEDEVEITDRQNPIERYKGKIVSMSKGCIEILEEKSQKYLTIFTQGMKVSKLADAEWIREIRDPKYHRKVSSKKLDKIIDAVGDKLPINIPRPVRKKRSTTSKRSIVEGIVRENIDKANKQIVDIVVEKTRMSKAGARTYVYNSKKKIEAENKKQGN